MKGTVKGIGQNGENNERRRKYMGRRKDTEGRGADGQKRKKKSSIH